MVGPRLATSGHTCFTPPRLEHRPVRSPRKPRTTSKASLARASPTSPSVPPLHVSRGTNIACRGRLAMRDGHGRRIGVSRAGLASIHATTLLQAWRSGCHDYDLFVLGLMARGAHPGRRSPSDRLGKWSGAHTRSAIPRRLRDGAVEQGLTRPCCCICSQAEASPPPGKGASSCSAGELRIIRSSSEALASGPKLVQRTIERSHLLRREPSSEREPPRRHC